VLKRIALLAGVAVVVLAALFLTGVVGGDDDQSEVSVERGDAVPKLSSLNRADDAGADTLRAYLAAALACDASGARLMAKLSRRGEASARSTFAAGCKKGRSVWSSLAADQDPHELDGRGRAIWRVDADGGSLPDGLRVRIRMVDAGWEVDRKCTGSCPAR
jgi:hypothetical protein